VIAEREVLMLRHGLAVEHCIHHSVRCSQHHYERAWAMDNTIEEAFTSYPWVSYSVGAPRIIANYNKRR
jgi:hypothetical protein